MRHCQNYLFGYCFGLSLTIAVPSALAETRCFNNRLAVQVLGSGGPVTEDERASSGYIVWVDKKSTVLVDAGGGVFLRFGQAKGKVADLALIAITHLHADHAADLPALVKSGYFSDRVSPLPIAGPDGNDLMPGVRSFLQALFNAQSGAFRYLSGALDGTNELFQLDAIEIESQTEAQHVVFQTPKWRVDAMGVKHGPIPALAYRIRAFGKTIIFSGDLNGRNPEFIEFAREADLLVIDHAIPEHADKAARSLHVSPSEIGEMAQAADVKLLLLSHRMGRSIRTEEENLKKIRTAYRGPVLLAFDLQCLPLIK